MRGGSESAEDLFRERVRERARHVARIAELALVAAESPEPERAAEYLLDALDDLRAVRAALRTFRP